MSKLRGPVRGTIDRGSAVFAIAEECHLGLATVRLATGGARLSNLAIMGGEVQPGSIVIVDYSAGVNPIVRPPLLAEIPYLTETQLELAVPPTPAANGETYGAAEDIGCRAYAYDFDHQWFDTGSPLWPIGHGVWTRLRFNYTDWDPANMVTGDTVTIPVSGFYLVSAFWDEAINGLEILGIKPPANPVYYEAWEFTGYYAIRVLKNGNVVLEMQGRDFEMVRGHAGVNGTLFDYFDEGDKLNMEVFTTIRVDNNYDMAYPIEGFTYSYYASVYWRRSLTVHCVLTG